MVALLESLTGAAPSVGFAHGMLARAAGCLAVVHERIRALITGSYAVSCDPLRVGPATPGEVYPDAIWPTQIADVLRGLIHAANLARAAGQPAIDTAVRDELITAFRHGVLVGLSQTTSHGERPGQRKARNLLEVLRDREPQHAHRAPRRPHRPALDARPTRTHLSAHPEPPTTGRPTAPPAITPRRACPPAECLPPVWDRRRLQGGGNGGNSASAAVTSSPIHER